jgi:homocysteine S-methyltransferase
MTSGSRPTLAAALAAEPVLLDGGLGTELEAAGCDVAGTLWSGQLLLDSPEAVQAAHGRFFEAGAQVATTASYQLSFDGLATVGVDRPRAQSLLHRSVEVAMVARSASATPELTWVAASIGPYGAALADGSEFRGGYGLSVAELRAWHRPRLAVLADAGADVLALETIPCLAEVEALLAEIDGTGVPSWLSLTCASPTRTRAGEPVAEAFTMAREVAEVIAVGINCLPPADARPLVATAAQTTGKPVVVYPNSGEVWDAARKSWHGTGSSLAGEVAGWVADGARLVGGCCRVLPAEISMMAAELTA